MKKFNELKAGDSIWTTRVLGKVDDLYIALQEYIYEETEDKGESVGKLVKFKPAKKEYEQTTGVIMTDKKLNSTYLLGGALQFFTSKEAALDYIKEEIRSNIDKLYNDIETTKKIYSNFLKKEFDIKDIK